MLAGNELYCYRQRGDKDHRVMHSMVGTFIKDMPKEYSNSESSNLFPVKIMLPRNKSRILYFKQEQQQLEPLGRDQHEAHKNRQKQQQKQKHRQQQAQPLQPPQQQQQQQEATSNNNKQQQHQHYKVQ